MRIRRTLVMTALVLPTLVGMSACGEIQEAQQKVQDVQQGLDAAGTCARAVGLMGFTPNFNNPEQAATDAQAKVEEIGKLAQETADQSLKQNLQSVQASLEQAASGTITPENAAEWLQKHAERTSVVLQACGGN